jgi:putative endonuclease
MYSVYVFYSKKVNKLYIGFTSRLKERIKEYKSLKNKTTRNWQPLKLIYVEIYANKQDALKREKFFKTGWGRNYLKKILKHTLNNINS